MPKPVRVTDTMREFDVHAYLDSVNVPKQIQSYGRGDAVYSQGDPGSTVFYLQEGTVRVSVVSQEGKEAVIATLRAGDFFGEGALTAQPTRVSTARAASACTVVMIDNDTMSYLLHEQQEFSDCFINYILRRNGRIESDLIDQIFNSSEKRLARALLLLAQYGDADRPGSEVVSVSQETLAKTIGTTRTRVNYFMNRFRKEGYIDYSGGRLKVHSSLVTLLLHD